MVDSALYVAERYLCFEFQEYRLGGLDLSSCKKHERREEMQSVGGATPWLKFAFAIGAWRTDQNAKPHFEPPSKSSPLVARSSRAWHVPPRRGGYCDGDHRQDAGLLVATRGLDALAGRILMTFAAYKLAVS
jgi:hypothetical protein